MLKAQSSSSALRCVTAHSKRDVIVRANKARIKQSSKNVPTVTTLEWQSPLEVLKYPDPRLRAINAKIAVFDDKLVQLANEMLDLMYQDDGVGLAAPQVGVNVRLMVFNSVGVRGKGQERILVNPVIVNRSVGTEVEEEGCLSFPRIYGFVERPGVIEVEAQDEKGQPLKMRLSGWVARLFQHEYDHLEGVLFPDRMKPAVLETVRDQLLAMEEEFISKNPGVKVQRLPARKKPVTKAVGFGPR